MLTFANLRCTWSTTHQRPDRQKDRLNNNKNCKEVSLHHRHLAISLAATLLAARPMKKGLSLTVLVQILNYI